MDFFLFMSRNAFEVRRTATCPVLPAAILNLWLPSRFGSLRFPAAAALRFLVENVTSPPHLPLTASAGRQITLAETLRPLSATLPGSTDLGTLPRLPPCSQSAPTRSL